MYITMKKCLTGGYIKHESREFVKHPHLTNRYEESDEWYPIYESSYTRKYLLEDGYNEDDIPKEEWYSFVDSDSVSIEDISNEMYPIVVCFKKTLKFYSCQFPGFEIFKTDGELRCFLNENCDIDITYIFPMSKNNYDAMEAEWLRKEKEFKEHQMRIQHFEGDVVITDPCYVLKHEDWNKDDFDYLDSRDYAQFGFTDVLVHSTLYGDWSCHTFKKETNEPIGEFCADAGMVGVFYADEIRKYKPDFFKINSWCYTLIENFNGYINFNISEQCGERELSVIGNGNINFYTSQTVL